MDNHEVTHVARGQRRRLARLGDEQDLVLGVHGLGIVAPAPPKLGAEGHAEVDATGDTQMLQRGDPGEGTRDGRDIEGDVRTEALPQQHHAWATLSGDGFEARLDVLEDIAGEHDAVTGLGHRECTRHECILRHDGRAIAAGEVFECLDDRVVDVADTGGARDADE